MTMIRTVFVMVAALGAAGSASLFAQRSSLDGLEAYVERAMRDWRVPGLAVAVVTSDSVVLARGFGVRTVGRPENVDAYTLFAIGSATKSFTVASLGLLVAEGKLGWDDPVTDRLPDFRLYDPYATREVTVRDLVTHRTGVSGGDFLWATGGFDRAEIARRVRHLEPTWSFRSRFDYSNIMFIAAGQVLEAVSGQTWDDFVDERLFTPLGMQQTNSTVRELPHRENVATPHDPIDGKPTPVAWRNMDNTVAGGGINSNVAEMARWLQLHLRRGGHAGRQLLSPDLIDLMQTPQVIIPREGPWAQMTPGSHFTFYGLGWILSDYHGRKALQHGGGIDGMSAMVGLLPEEDLGLVVLSNLNGNSLPHAIMFRIFDAYLGRPERDWSAWYLEESRRQRAQSQAQLGALEAELVSGTSPSVDLEQYTGSYGHEAYGVVKVTLRNGMLHMRWGPQFDGTLEHLQYDAFRAHWENPARGTDILNFSLDARRRVVALDVFLWVTARFERLDH